MAKQLTLPDGRNLDYSITGAREGFPLIWCHGTPSGYIPIPALARSCEKKGLKLVTFSRSGYGGSSRRKGRNIVDDVDDVRALSKHLGHDKFVVGGWSGGGPHSLACAAKLEGCVASIVIAGVAPYNVEGLDWLAGQGQDNIDEYAASMKGEYALREYCDAQRPGLISSTAAGIIEQLSAILPEVDKRALRESAELGSYMEQTMREGLKSSCDGWIDDDFAFLAPWGFDVADIKVPVFLYQGSEDLMVPFAHGQWLGSHINQKYLTNHLEQGEGHISIFLGRVDTMLDEIKAVIDDKAQ
ncbi:uncharacterized protein A1O5_07714 [Cladophialophora psammophila CBS 110553]|uniref:AB hydrolase-1 domain-containing protein n=1 Tax=Cladophialophora psammophila CBS 110553 TaxID=1182543 RepID=W9WLI6_9EURO|nr:uncharacterized protein A1O5_07714 [Cladophialophora psammophila CBS 110553]EXJ68783.1 hypothetical protein A1O5_07714 [Cladophialophora psammophila CBS 110553]